VVTAVRADASDAEGVALAAAAATTHRAARAPGFTLVHAGGVLADDKLAAQRAGGVRDVAAPKVGGAIRLLGAPASAAGASGPAILFSSIAALLGAAGQANYSASNAFLDAQAWSRRRRGAPTLSVQWGAWAGGGMADAGVLKRAARMGIGAVSPSDGLEALARLLLVGAAAPVVAVSPFDWRPFLSLLPKPLPPFYDAVAAAPDTALPPGTYDGASASAAAFARSGGDGAATAAGLSSSAAAAAAAGSTDAARALHALPTAAERLGAVSEDILRIVRDVASVEIGPSEPLMDSGIDSLAGVELKNKVEALYGVELPATAAFDYPSVEALAGYLTSQLDAAAASSAVSAGDERLSAAAAAAAAVVASPSPSAFGMGPAAPQQPPSAVAVLGWAGSAPAAAVGAGATACPAAVDGISVIPSHERWDHDLAGALDPAEAITAAAAASGRFGGWVPAVARFDAALFSVSVAEASLMDPQQRHLLEAVHTLALTPTVAPAFAAAAGLPGSAASSSGAVAVAVGLSVMDYSRIIPSSAGAPPSPYLGTGNAVSVACGRLSYQFGFKGASITVDTACSSSLVAAHLARGVITGGGGGTATAGAVAAGAALILSPQATGIFAAAGMLSPDGRCKTLDAAADGYVRTEAVWALPLWSTERPTSSSATAAAAAAAVRAAPALLVSSAVNQDGRSSSLTAPNGPSQQETITGAARAAFPSLSKPADALEMHGTGTALGDPIEFGAAVAVISAAHEGFARLSGAASEGAEGSATAALLRPTLALSSIKSSFGHSEAAAGVWGLVHAASQLHRRGGGQVPHLRALNPYVAQVIDRRGESTPAAAARRQDHASITSTRHAGGGGGGGTSLSVCGVSSFAFQGTNAHALVGAAATSAPKSAVAVGALGGRRAGLLDRKKIWCAVQPPPLLTRCLGVNANNDGGIQTAVMLADLSSPRHVSLATQHAVLGNRVVPAALVVIVAAAGARLALAHSTMFDTSGPDEVGAGVHCCGVVLPRVAGGNGSGAGGAGRRLRVEVDVRGGVSICDEEDGGGGGGAEGAHLLLTCTVAGARLGGGGGVKPTVSRRRRQAMMAAAASAAFDGGGVDFVGEQQRISSYAVARRGAGSSAAAGGLLCGGASETTTFAAVDAAWFPDLADDDDGDGLCDEIGVRRAMAGGDSSSSSSRSAAMTTARCHSWALVGARTRVITQAAIDLELSPPPTTAAAASLRAAAAASSRPRHPPLDQNNQVMLTLLRWISSVLFSTSQRGRRGAADVDESDVGYEAEDEAEAEAEVEAKAAAAAEAASAMLAEVLEVLNAAPRPEGADPIHRDTNLMDAGFDSLQVMVWRGGCFKSTLLSIHDPEVKAP
jgi:3-oxoacyl-(acyl-carrier-protein) synthase/acyl carrier protein